MHKTKFYLPKKKKTNKSPAEKRKSSKWTPVFVYKKTSSCNHPQEVRHTLKIVFFGPYKHTAPLPPPLGRAYFCDFMPACVWVCVIAGWLLKHGRRRRGPDK